MAIFAPEKKLELARREIWAECGCTNGCVKCAPLTNMLMLMGSANIPAGYWNLKMSDFRGSDAVKTAVAKYASEINKSYSEGASLCFAGTLGTGKTYAICNILKSAIAHGYSSYYTSLIDLVGHMSDFSTKTKFSDLVMQVDFLAIDEIDARHIASTEAAQDFFGSSFERVVRYRFQNRLPCLMATNNISVDEAFSGQFRKTIDSLGFRHITIVPAMGTDFRKRGVKGA